MKAGPGQTAFEIAAKIKWSARGTPFHQFPPHQKWFAMGETLAHLYHLREKGQVERQMIDGTFRYFFLGQTADKTGH